MEKVIMTPEPGVRLLHFVGDQLGFRLRLADGKKPGQGWRGFLRTNLGRARQLRHEIIHAHTGKLGLGTSSWRDIPMRWREGAWEVLALLG